jgi:hypothetical protein
MPALGDNEDDCGEADGNVDWQGKPRFSEKTCPSATFVHHKKSHMTRPGFEPGKPATNRLSYGAAVYRPDRWLVGRPELAWALWRTEKLLTPPVQSQPVAIPTELSRLPKNNVLFL